MKKATFRKPHTVLLTNRYRTNVITGETIHDIFEQIDRPSMWDGIIYESEKADFEPEELQNLRIFEEMTEDEVKAEIEHIYGATEVTFSEEE